MLTVSERQTNTTTAHEARLIFEKDKLIEQNGGRNYYFKAEAINSQSRS